MTVHALLRLALAMLLAGFAASGAAPAQQSLPLDRIRLPAGFVIDLYARVPGAREMTWGAQGTLFVGSRAGEVYALSPSRDGGGAPRVRTIARGLDAPAGVAFHDGALYVAELGRIVRLPGVEQRLDDPPAPQPVAAIERGHGLKFIAFGPDGRLYVPVGAPCNICERDPDRYAIIGRMNPDGSGFEVVARGVRNSVGFDWDPRTRDLWFTNNGRDRMGDDVPADTLNRLSRLGEHFGYPYCHAGNVPDPQYGRERPCGDFAAPAARLGPHVAALGMRFYTGRQFPEEFRNQVFIAEHGSWNRSRKIGYRVTLVRLDAQRRAVSYTPFAQGWLEGENEWGRPADVIVAPDGSLLVSDDRAGAIYRIRYRG
jgi:glucose/arabinose dehydrogenase